MEHGMGTGEGVAATHVGLETKATTFMLIPLGGARLIGIKGIVQSKN